MLAAEAKRYTNFPVSEVPQVLGETIMYKDLPQRLELQDKFVLSIPTAVEIQRDDSGEQVLTHGVIISIVDVTPVNPQETKYDILRRVAPAFNAAHDENKFVPLDFRFVPNPEELS